MNLPPDIQKRPAPKRPLPIRSGLKQAALKQAVRMDACLVALKPTL